MVMSPIICPPFLRMPIPLLAVVYLSLSCCSQPKTTTLFTYPGGKTKALIMSYDDGTIDDISLARLFDRHGIVGTFNLNSGYIGTTKAWPGENGDSVYQQYLPIDSLKSTYRNHEIAAHGVYHHDLLQLTEEEAREEIELDIERLRELSGRPIRSMAYSFGRTNAKIARLISNTELTNARTIDDTQTFGLPENAYRWNPTCHDSRANALLDKYLDLDDQALSLLYVWGHSWELKDPDRWLAVKTFCETIGDREDIWYVGCGDYIDYLAALDRISNENGYLVNPSDNAEVWVRRDHESVVLKPGGELLEP
jgi:peptidoglycan/xylan/chitin deacetylase (PgdA/CDA1 family)